MSACVTRVNHSCQVVLWICCEVLTAVVGCCAVSCAMAADSVCICAVLQEPSEERPAAPDSTTKERSGFSEGEDVLFQHKDGRYYLGTIVEVRTEPRVTFVQCHVRAVSVRDSCSMFHWR